MIRHSPDRWFWIRLALVGSPHDVIQASIHELIQEISYRDYLKIHRVYWEADTQRVILEVEDQGHDSEQTAKNVAEEIFEISAGTLGDYEKFRIDILDVQTRSV